MRINHKLKMELVYFLTYPLFVINPDKILNTRLLQNQNNDINFTFQDNCVQQFDTQPLELGKNLYLER